MDITCRRKGRELGWLVEMGGWVGVFTMLVGMGMVRKGMHASDGYLVYFPMYSITVLFSVSGQSNKRLVCSNYFS